MRGRRVARAIEAPSRDALREILRCNANRALDCALPAPGNGHTHEEPAVPGCARETTAPLSLKLTRHKDGLPSWRDQRRADLWRAFPISL